ncbi:MAG: GDYXXLXY domain-containing protein [Phyllobacteriaceae bacterium]|nr:GDYXXLXY domain-containing protein [Phyllobacteriaceae bacterium]
MRRASFLLAGVAVLAVLGWKVWDAEALIARGDEVMLALAPVDPRSLMQGDYMRLAWALERETIRLDGSEDAIVLGFDERRVGRFRRLADGGAPAADERIFRVRRSPVGDGVMVEPHSFLFEEGRADLYAKARYGIFRVDADGRHLLVGLADADARRIDPR